MSLILYLVGFLFFKKQIERFGVKTNVWGTSIKYVKKIGKLHTVGGKVHRVEIYSSIEYGFHEPAMNPHLN